MPKRGWHGPVNRVTQTRFVLAESEGGPGTVAFNAMTGERNQPKNKAQTGKGTTGALCKAQALQRNMPRKNSTSGENEKRGEKECMGSSNG